MMTSRIKNKNAGLYIVLTWLLCGTLDMLSAVIINPQVPFPAICRYIASGFFGKADAFDPAHTEMVTYGLLFHYLIALCFTFVLFKLYPTFKKLINNPVTLILVFGLIIWGVMNLIVVPLSGVPKPKGPYNYISMLKNMLALMIAFGVPITFIAKRFYKV